MGIWRKDMDSPLASELAEGGVCMKSSFFSSSTFYTTSKAMVSTWISLEKNE